MSPEQPTRICIHCRQSFTPRTSRQKYCTFDCYCKYRVGIPIERLEQYLDKTTDPNGCWLWTGYICRRYAYITINGKIQRAHRTMWILMNGPIPPGLYVCHRCDRPTCLNPAHLFLGTPRDNLQDAATKGRILRGEKHPRAKLTDADVRAIRAATGNQRLIAERFGVYISVIEKIRARKMWTHLD